MKVWFLVSAFSLAACGQSAAPPVVTEAPPAARAPLALEPLAGAPIEGRLSGELGCSFSAGQDVLLLAMGNVDAAARSEALVVRDGAVMQLAATELGGYDGLVDGAMFAGDALSVEVTPGARNETGTEQVAYAATLSARRADEERSYAGVWTCGP